MIDKYLKFQTLSIVIIGDFNPIIFQPFWLANKELIREDEAKNAQIVIIHNDIVRYELADWLVVDINRNRCEFKSTKEPYFEPLKDLVCSIFDILNETPIKSFGINHIYDISLSSKEEYFKFGDTLAPLNFWDDNLNEPKLLQLEVYEKEREGYKGASRRIRITPSDQSISFGVSINVNNHFELDNKTNSKCFTSNIQKFWFNSFIESKKIANDLLNKIIV